MNNSKRSNYLYLVYSEETTGWRSAAPREEISPAFYYDPLGGVKGDGALIIEADGRKGLDGYWTKAFPVIGGHHYHFNATYRAEDVSVPRRCIVAKIEWQDAQGGPVTEDRPMVSGYLGGRSDRAWSEHPATLESVETEYESDGTEYTEIDDTYRAPLCATQAAVELHLQWAPGGYVEWSGISFAEIEPPPERRVRLAAVHFQPRGGSPEENRRLYAPFIAEAGCQKADLVVLGETLTYYGKDKSFAEVAEPIPGPSTAYFGELARQHNLYIVAGLVERAGHLMYNTAALLGPDGDVIGTYRKVALPRNEIQAGIAPGEEYPVFRTRFGDLGMMICYDGFFPEVARALTNRGAEVIAWPVWGCNPLLAAARACENHVYLVSSTYEDIKNNWMVSGVFDHEGKTIAVAKEWGSITVAEVDLEARTRWISLGDFKAEIPRHRPIQAGLPL